MSVNKALIASVSVVIAACFFLPGQEGAFRVSKWGINGFALLSLSGAFVFSLKRSPSPYLPKERGLFLCASGFIAAASFLPALFTPYRTVHIAGTLWLLTGFSFAWLTALSFQESPSLKRRGIVLVVAAGGISAVVVILQALGVHLFDIPMPIPGSMEFRAPGTFGNPNWAAAFLLPLPPLSLALARGSKCGEKKLFLALTALIVLGTVATLSKAGVLALLGGLFVYCLSDPRLKPAVRKLSALALLALITAILLLMYRNDLQETLPWVRGRLFLWRAAAALLWRHPVTGIGLGGFLPAYLDAAAGLVQGNAHEFMPLTRIDFLHNDPLQMAVEGGLISGALYLVLVFSTIRTAWAAKDHLSRGAGAAVAAIGLYGLADSPLQLPATFVLFWFLAGWIMSGIPAAASTPHSGANRQPRLVARALWGSVLCLMAGIGLIQGARFTLGNYSWSEGIRLLQDRNTAGVTALRTAAECLPEIGKIRSAYARSLAAAGQKREALVQLEAASCVYSDFNDRFLRLRLLEAIEGRDQSYHWRKLADEFPRLVTPHLELGRLYLRQGDREAAAGELKAVLRNPQDTQGAKICRARARQMLQDLSGGRGRHADWRPPPASRVP